MKSLLFVLSIFSGTMLYAQENVTIQGKITNLEGHQIIISYLNSNGKAHSRVTPLNGKFETTLNISDVQEITISPYRFTGNSIRDTVRKFYHTPPPLTIFVSPGDRIRLKGDALHIWKAKVKGGRYIKEYEQLRSLTDPLITQGDNLKRNQYALLLCNDTTAIAKSKETQRQLSSEIRAVTKEYFTTQKNSVFAVYKLFQSMKSLQPGEVEEIFSTYSHNVQQTSVGQRVGDFIEKNSIVGPGSQMIDFEGNTLTNKVFTTVNLLGKYILLDFWGSWCGPCRKSNPHLKELYAKYKDKGFDIVGIAYEMMPTIEKCKQATLNAVKEDGLPWQQLLNNELAEKFDVVKAYNVGAFPTKILIDKSGKILWKGIGTEETQLDKLLAYIFGD
ncbi:MAG: redoxin domain-containing protein [Chitinophagaceae bacterium]|nr:redoxin domain-containing protein [Chitinophagaceae bacterium]MCW5914445.1 redoxin domain-containing protein [Chitinophagaceae bacterium]MCZ2395452.1 redoxin domain-containing protein [Chitinophagales bacterium]